MSRIGKLPIKIPNGVEIKISQNMLQITGPNGELDLNIPNKIKVAANNENNQINVIKTDTSKEAQRNQGLIRSLIQNMVTGVSQMFQKRLEIRGVGYRSSIEGKNLILNVGYSHPVEIPIPEGIEVKIEGNVNLTIQGINKEKVGSFSSKIRAVRPPEPYKGKGIRYLDEIVQRKAGKSGK